MSTATDGQSLQADAFKKLYPEQYFARFLNDGVRPDGRTLGRSRATTIGLGAVTAVDGSALVRLGHTTVLAGVKLDITRPSESTPDQGQITYNVELAPFSSADYRPGKPMEIVSIVSERLGSVLCNPDTLPLEQLCISKGKACWSATVDIYILNSDGSVFDAALLATVAALHDVRVPPVEIMEHGARRQTEEEASTSGSEHTKLQFGAVTLGSTCCMYDSHILVDPTSEEEAIATSTVSVVVDSSGRLHGEHLGCAWCIFACMP